jgi:hypothetical protein
MVVKSVFSLVSLSREERRFTKDVVIPSPS